MSDVGDSRVESIHIPPTNGSGPPTAMTRYQKARAKRRHWLHVAIQKCPTATRSCPIVPAQRTGTLAQPSKTSNYPLSLVVVVRTESPKPNRGDSPAFSEAIDPVDSDTSNLRTKTRKEIARWFTRAQKKLVRIIERTKMSTATKSSDST